MTCKIHLATDGKGRPLGLVLTGGNAADTSFFTTVLDTISVNDGRPGRPRRRPDRVLADKAYTSAANRRFLTTRGIKVTIPGMRGPKGRTGPSEARTVAAPQLRRGNLPRPKRRRTLLQPTQAVERHRHPQRQDSTLLPRRTGP
jgi:transposase